MKITFNPAKLTVSVGGQKMKISSGKQVVKEYVNVPPYEGDYTITPSTETLTISTQNKRMTADLVINPIPQNYGLITWDGSTLIVS